MPFRITSARHTNPVLSRLLIVAVHNSSPYVRRPVRQALRYYQPSAESLLWLPREKRHGVALYLSPRRYEDALLGASSRLVPHDDRLILDHDDLLGRPRRSPWRQIANRGYTHTMSRAPWIHASRRTR
jgi:hypothetical protein